MSRPVRPGPLASERATVGLVGALQFVYVVDFAMVLPLGPDLTGPLGVAPSALGWLAAAYTGAAALTCTLTAGILDRFDRRTALGVSTAGLVGATLSCAAAESFSALLACRMIAGAFGGVAASLGQSVLADRVPPERRGRAMGAVMGANALGAVVGVPTGLWTAGLLGWRAPFLLVGAAGAVLLAGALLALPAMRDHVGLPRDGAGALLRRPVVWRAWLLVFLLVGATFLLTPNLSAFVQHNLGFPRERLPGVYAAGGALSLLAMRIVGRLVDRHGAFRVGTVALLGFLLVTHAYLVRPEPALPVTVGFVALLVSLSSRNVAIRALTTQVPGPGERGRYLSLQNAVHQAAAAAGAGMSAALLDTAADGVVIGMPRLGWIAIAATAAATPLLWQVERAVRRGSTAPAVVARAAAGGPGSGP